MSDKYIITMINFVINQYFYKITRPYLINFKMLMQLFKS